jgi:hypothetical protein
MSTPTPLSNAAAPGEKGQRGSEFGLAGAFAERLSIGQSGRRIRAPVDRHLRRRARPKLPSEGGVANGGLSMVVIARSATERLATRGVRRCDAGQHSQSSGGAGVIQGIILACRELGDVDESAGVIPSHQRRRHPSPRWHARRRAYVWQPTEPVTRSPASGAPDGGDSDDAVNRRHDRPLWSVTIGNGSLWS